MDDLSSFLTTAAKYSAGPDGWLIAGCVLGALGALAIFAYGKWFKKGADSKNLVDDVKNFFLMKENAAADLAKILYWYLSIKCVIVSIELLTLGGSSAFWNFLTSLVGGLVWYRFVYECVKAILAFVSKKEK